MLRSQNQETDISFELARKSLKFRKKMVEVIHVVVNTDRNI